MADTYTVERQRHVKASVEAVRERIVDLHRWETWSPWEDLDPQVRRTYGGPAAGVGAWYEWAGNRKGPDFEKGLARLGAAAEAGTGTGTGTGTAAG